MENNSLNNPTREFVWKINKTPKKKAKTPKTDSSKVGELVEKQFQKMSMILFDKISTLESEVTSIKQRNLQLEQQISETSQVAYANDQMHDPWYL